MTGMNFRKKESFLAFLSLYFDGFALIAFMITISNFWKTKLYRYPLTFYSWKVNKNFSSPFTKILWVFMWFVSTLLHYLHSRHRKHRFSAKTFFDRCVWENQVYTSTTFGATPLVASVVKIRRVWISWVTKIVATVPVAFAKTRKKRKIEDLPRIVLSCGWMKVIENWGKLFKLKGNWVEHVSVIKPNLNWRFTGFTGWLWHNLPNNSWLIFHQ